MEFLHNIKKALLFDSSNVLYFQKLEIITDCYKKRLSKFYYDIIIENFPNFSDVFYWKSLINIKKEDYSSALDNMNRAINIEEKTIILMKELVFTENRKTLTNLYQITKFA